MKKLTNYLVFFKLLFVVLAVTTNSSPLYSQACVSCDGTTTSGLFPSAIGRYTKATANYSFAGGIYSEAKGSASFAFGNRAFAEGGSSAVLGQFARVNTSTAMVFGAGFDIDNPLINSETHSLMIGFGSTKPTLFVGRSIGVNSTGKVGIGNVTDPQAKLHIRADDGMIGEDATLMLEATKTGKSNKILMQGGHAYIGTTSERYSLNFFTGEGNNRMIIDGESGNVGIGTLNPGAELEVVGQIKMTGGAPGQGKVLTSDGTGLAAWGTLSPIATNNPTQNNMYARVNSNGAVTWLTANDVRTNINAAHITHTHSANDITSGTMPVARGGTGLNSVTQGSILFGGSGALNTSGNLYWDNNNGRLGLGTTSPGSSHQVNGNVAIGYSSSTSAPDNGLSVAGNVGIGTSSIMQIHGNASMFAGVIPKLHIRPSNNQGAYQEMVLLQQSYNGTSAIRRLGYIMKLGGAAENEVDKMGGMVLDSESDWGNHPKLHLVTSNQKRLTIISNGSIGIGTTNPDPDYKLTVAGWIHAQRVRVTADAGADFVFHEDYTLKSLNDLDHFIRDNKHLPDIPSEKEMIEDGLDVGQFQIKLLQKIEELTLYVIEQQKEIENLKRIVLIDQ